MIQDRQRESREEAEQAPGGAPLHPADEQPDRELASGPTNSSMDSGSSPTAGRSPIAEGAQDGEQQAEPLSTGTW